MRSTPPDEPESLAPDEPESLGLGELARRAGVPVATVKYYLREGLLPEGRLRSTTRADYGAMHLERLRLLRLLREVGDVPVDRLRALVTALESPSDDPFDVLSPGTAALIGTLPEPGPYAERAEALAADLVAEGGWEDCPPDLAERESLRAVLEQVLTWEEIGLPVRAGDLTPYVEAADAIARHDVTSMRDGDPQELLLQVVVGQVVYGELLGALRRVAEAHHAVRRWGDGVDDG